MRGASEIATVESGPTETAAESPARTATSRRWTARLATAQVSANAGPSTTLTTAADTSPRAWVRTEPGTSAHRGEAVSWCIVAATSRSSTACTTAGSVASGATVSTYAAGRDDVSRTHSRRSPPAPSARRRAARRARPVTSRQRRLASGDERREVLALLEAGRLVDVHHVPGLVVAVLDVRAQLVGQAAGGR